MKLKNKVQDECDYDEAAVEEERQDASDDEGEAELNLNDEAKDDGEPIDEDEVIQGVASNEFQPQYKIDKEKHLWCELSFQVLINSMNCSI